MLLFYHYFLSILNQQALGCAVHALAVEVIDGSIVGYKFHAVDHVNNNVKWHPYKGYQVPETFSLAIYTDLSAVTNVAADKAVMLAVGGNSGNHATLYKMGDKVKLDYNGGPLETSLPAGGYHLYTVTYSPSAITLSVDSGDAVSACAVFFRNVQKAGEKA